MKTYKDVLDALEQDAIEKYFAYASLRTADPANPDVPVLRKKWQESSNQLRALLYDMKDNRIHPEDALPAKVA